MFTSKTLTAALLSALPATLANELSPAYEISGNATGIPACDALMEAGLGDRVIIASHKEYEPQLETWWAKNSRLRPYCIVMPHNTEEVSLALSTLVDVNPGAGDWHIAIRSGGHSLTGNNIEYGVTIDLSNLNSTSYDPETNVASLHSGARWKNAYAELDDLGVVVTGGRDGNVGVGGFLLGGGISYFSGSMGWGCDSIVNYEVVLANGTIVNANKTANADLWLALKGGSGNFGLVTRFDMEAMPTRDVFYETRIMSSNFSDALVDTVVGFADQDQSFQNDALVTYLSHDTSRLPGIHMLTIHVNTEGEATNNTAFSHVKKVPAYESSSTRQTIAESANGSQVEGDDYYVRSTVTFGNDKEIVQFCIDEHKKFVETVKGFMSEDDLTTLMFLQPIPSYLSSVSEEFGGNMLGIESMKSNSVMWTIGAGVASNQADFARVKLEVAKMTSRIQEFARCRDAEVDFIFLNYADALQDSLGSYGADNVQHMRDVAEKYDPTGVFQTRIPGGFKISAVA